MQGKLYPTGPTGNTGIQGVQGNLGGSGLQGVTGIQGIHPIDPTHSTGSQGIQEQGPMVHKGNWCSRFTFPGRNGAGISNRNTRNTRSARCNLSDCIQPVYKVIHIQPTNRSHWDNCIRQVLQLT